MPLILIIFTMFTIVVLILGLTCFLFLTSLCELTLILCDLTSISYLISFRCIQNIGLALPTTWLSAESKMWVNFKIASQNHQVETCGSDLCDFLMELAFWDFAFLSENRWKWRVSLPISSIDRISLLDQVNAIPLCSGTIEKLCGNVAIVCRT